MISVSSSISAYHLLLMKCILIFLFIGCIADRDFYPGWSILENITEAITKSYKVILLTDHFIKSKWCEYEADQALIVRLLETNQNCVIPIILEQCEIPNKLKRLAYLDLTLDNNSLAELQKLESALLPGDEMICSRI